MVHNGFIALLVIMVVVAVRGAKDEFFRVNPLDYLVLIAVLLAATLSELGYADVVVVFS